MLLLSAGAQPHGPPPGPAKNPPKAGGDRFSSAGGFFGSAGTSKAQELPEPAEVGADSGGPSSPIGANKDVKVATMQAVYSPLPADRHTLPSSAGGCDGDNGNAGDYVQKSDDILDGAEGVEHSQPSVTEKLQQRSRDSSIKVAGDDRISKPETSKTNKLSQMLSAVTTHVKNSFR